MSKDKNWKRNLLSSGLPLEFDAAKVLVSKGFSIDSDYTYDRNDSEASGISKDFSVDIEASAYPPFDDENDIQATLRLLVECKYRYPNTTWLFFPDINRPDFSDFTAGYTLHVIDEFSPYTVDTHDCQDFESRLPVCYKGAEVRLGSKDQEVFDVEIRHAISQLRYALPQLLMHNISFQLNNHPDDNVPIIFCPILLTTADLSIVHETVTIEEVNRSENMSDISDEVPYLILTSGYGPDFENHCTKKFKKFTKLGDLDKVKKLEERRRQSSVETYDFLYPSKIGESLANAERFFLRMYFNQFFICNFYEFPNFVDEIKDITSSTIRTRKEI